VTPLFADRSAPPPFAESPFSLRDRLAQAEWGISQHPAQAPYYLTLAELLHFQMYWLEAAAPMYERVLQLSPERNDIRWRLIDIYLNTTDVDGQERQYLELLKRIPQDALLQHLYHNWFRRMYEEHVTFVLTRRRSA